MYLLCMTTRTTKAAADMVSAVATKALNEMGFAPIAVDWIAGKTFQATFRRDVDAKACARKLRGLGRTAEAKPARFDDDAFVSFVL